MTITIEDIKGMKISIGTPVEIGFNQNGTNLGYFVGADTKYIYLREDKELIDAPLFTASGKLNHIRLDSVKEINELKYKK